MLDWTLDRERAFWRRGLESWEFGKAQIEGVINRILEPGVCCLDPGLFITRFVA